MNKYGTSHRHHADFVSAEKYAQASGLNIWSDPEAYAKSKNVPAGVGA